MKRRPGQLSQAAPSTLMTRFLAVVDLPEVGQALGHAAASPSYQDLACLLRGDGGLCRRARVRDAVVAAAAARLVRPGTRAAHRVLAAVGSGVYVVVLFHDRHHESHRSGLRGKRRLLLSLRRKLASPFVGELMVNEDSVLESCSSSRGSLSSSLDHRQLQQHSSGSRLRSRSSPGDNPSARRGLSA